MRHSPEGQKLSVLILGPHESAKIDSAIAAALANPVPWEKLAQIATDASVLKLKDRRPGVDAVRNEYPPQNVMLGTYRAAISFEMQPSGLLRHLSVSSNHPKKVPGLEVMKIIAEAFGFWEFPPKVDRGRIWMEEFEPGRHAINIVQIEPKEGEVNASTWDA